MCSGPARSSSSSGSSACVMRETALGAIALTMMLYFAPSRRSTFISPTTPDFIAP